MSDLVCADPADVLALGPDCTVRAIASIHEAILRAVSDRPVLRLDCGAVEQADLSFVQLIVSAQASVAARQGRVVIERMPACVATAFARCGVDLPGTDAVAAG